MASAVKPSIRINEYVTWRARGKWSAGGAAMSPEVAQRVIQLFREIRPPAHADYHLTPHETRLLTLLVDGHNFKMAAEESGICNASRTRCTSAPSPKSERKCFPVAYSDRKLSVQIVVDRR